MNGDAAARTAAIAGGRGSAVIYEIYPRSFQATGQSPRGSLRGVLSRLDYVASLGVDAIWLAPAYASPMEDGGYDVADHCAIDPSFGSMQDYDRVIQTAHRLGLAVLVDLVFNHTSDRHRWYQAALAGDEHYASFYHFQPARPDGHYPNNWRSFFGAPAWQWVPERGEFVLTQFGEHQPALNLRNPHVQSELERIVRFWADRGADGFRCDAAASYLSDGSFADNPPASDEVVAGNAVPANNPYAWQDHRHDMLPGDGADFMQCLRAWAGEQRFLLGELNAGNRSIELARAFTKSGRLDAVYTVDLTGESVTPRQLANLLDRKGDGNIAWLMSSHDQARAVSRLGDGSARDARFWLTLLLTLPGHALLFQGEELGLPQPDLPFDAITDPYDLAYYPEHPGRDGARVPMPWEAERPNAGFTDGDPWLPAHPEASMLAADIQGDDPASTLNYCREVIALRRCEAALHGADAIVEHADDQCLVLRRPHPSGDLRQVSNFHLTDTISHPVEGRILLHCNHEPGGVIGPRGIRIERLDPTQTK